MPTMDQAFYDGALETQGRATLLANGLAADMDALFHRQWRKFLRLLMKDPDAAARAITVDLENEVLSTLMNQLRGTAVDAWNDHTRMIHGAVPQPLLGYLALQSPNPPGQSTESGGLALGLRTAPDGSHSTTIQIMERGVSAFFGGDPGDVQPELAGLFQPPSPAQVDAAILASSGGVSWPERLKNWDRADDIAVEIRAGIIAGDSRQTIARRILPLTDKKRVSANRIARTETHRITVQMQMDSSRQTLGAALYGWRYIATLDDRTQPEHAALDGVVYAVGDPSMPTLPQRSNCRCVYAPVVKTLEQLGLPPEISDLFTPKDRAAFQGGSKLTGGKPGTVKGDISYGTWFNRQKVAVKRRILGVGNYNTLRQGGKVRWTDALQTFGVRRPETTLPSVLALFPASPPPPPPLGTPDQPNDFVDPNTRPDLLN